MWFSLASAYCIVVVNNFFSSHYTHEVTVSVSYVKLCQCYAASAIKPNAYCSGANTSQGIRANSSWLPFSLLFPFPLLYSHSHICITIPIYRQSVNPIPIPIGPMGTRSLPFPCIPLLCMCIVQCDHCLKCLKRRHAQEPSEANCRAFTMPNSHDLNPIDYKLCDITQQRV